MGTGKITFGVELECVKLSGNASQLIQQHGFQRHFDGSIRGPRGETLPATIEAGGGSEVVTPIYTVDVSMDAEGKHVKLDYGSAKSAIKALCDCAVEINTSCGIHVHLGLPGKDGKSAWKPEAVRTMLGICMLREEHLFKLVPPSRHNNRHCARIKERFDENDLQSFYPMGTPVPRKSDNPKRYCWLNLIETRRKGNDPRPNRQSSPATGTIEIRLLGNTRRFEYVWAWVQLWVKVATYVGHLSSSLALMHCVVTDALATEMEAVRQAKCSGLASERITEDLEHASEPAHPEPNGPRRWDHVAEANLIPRRFDHVAEASLEVESPERRVQRMRRSALTTAPVNSESIPDEVEPDAAVSATLPGITVRRGNRTEQV